MGLSQYILNENHKMQNCECGIVIINIENVETLCILLPFSSSFPFTPTLLPE